MLEINYPALAMLEIVVDVCQFKALQIYASHELPSSTYEKYAPH